MRRDEVLLGVLHRTILTRIPKSSIATTKPGYCEERGRPCSSEQRFEMHEFRTVCASWAGLDKLLYEGIGDAEIVLGCRVLAHHALCKERSVLFPCVGSFGS